MSSHFYGLVLLWIIFSQYFGLREGIEECTDSTGMSWRLVHNDSHPTGHSQLMIKLNKVHPSGQYMVVLGCEGVIVRGPGMKTTELSKRKPSYVYYSLELPPINFEETSDRHTKYHKCMVELKQKSIMDTQFKVVSECRLTIRATLWRIVPHCDEVGNNNLVREVDMKQRPGTVRVFFKHSDNNVAKISRECKNMDIINADEGYDMFALSSTGGERIYSVDFYPDCSDLNESYHDLLMSYKDRNPDCFLVIHAVCQEGQKLQGSYHVEMDPGAFECSKPKSKFTLFIESVKLFVRIESGPIAFLLVVLAGIGSLYLLLIPCLITICIFQVEKYVRVVQQRMKDVKRHKRKFVTKDNGNILPPLKEKSSRPTKYDNGDVFMVYETTTDVKKRTMTTMWDGGEISFKKRMKTHRGERLKPARHNWSRETRRVPKIKEHMELYSELAQEHHRKKPTEKEDSKVDEPSIELLREPSREAPLPPVTKTRVHVDIKPHGKYSRIVRNEAAVASIGTQINTPSKVVVSSVQTEPTKEELFQHAVIEQPRMENRKKMQRSEKVAEDVVRDGHYGSHDIAEEDHTCSTVSGYMKMRPVHPYVIWPHNCTSSASKTSTDTSKLPSTRKGQSKSMSKGSGLGKEDVPEAQVTEVPIIPGEAPVVDEKMYSQKGVRPNAAASSSEERAGFSKKADYATAQQKEGSMSESITYADILWAGKFTGPQLITVIRIFLKELDPSLADDIIDSFTKNLNKSESTKAIEVLLTELDMSLSDSEGALAEDLDPVKISTGVMLFLIELDKCLTAKNTGDGYLSDKKNRDKVLTQKEWDSEQLVKAHISLLDQLKPPLHSTRGSQARLKLFSVETVEESQSTKQSSRRSLQGINPSLLKKAVQSFLIDLDPSLLEESLALFLENLEVSLLEEAVESFLDQLGLQFGMHMSDKLDPSLSDQAIGVLLQKLDSQSDTAEDKVKDNKEFNVTVSGQSNCIHLCAQRIFLLRELDPVISTRAVSAFVDEIYVLESSHSDVGLRYHGVQSSTVENACHASGMTACTPSQSAQHVKVQQQLLQDQESGVDKACCRESASALAVQNEKSSQEIEGSVAKRNKSSVISHAYMSAVETARQVTNSNSDVSYLSMVIHSEDKPSVEVLSQQRKSRKIFKKSSIVEVDSNRKASDLFSLDRYADEQIKHFVESSGNISGKRSSSTRDSDEYASALSKHSSASSKHSSVKCSDTAVTNSNKKYGEQMKQDYTNLTVMPIQPDSSVKYTLVRRHTLGGTEISTSIPETIECPPPQLQQADDLQSYQLTEDLLPPQQDQLTKDTQSPRQEHTTKDTQSPRQEHSAKGTHPRQEYSTKGTPSPTQEDQLNNGTHSPQQYKPTEDQKSPGLDKWNREAQSSQQLIGRTRTSVRSNSISGPSASHSNRGMEDDEALQRFFKYHRRAQDSRHSFAAPGYNSGLTHSESDTLSESQLPQEFEGSSLHHLSLPPLPPSHEAHSDLDQLLGVHQASLPDEKISDLAAGWVQDTSQQEEVQERTQDVKGPLLGTTRKIRRKWSEDYTEPAQILKSVQGRRSLPSHGQVEREFIPFRSSLQIKEQDSQIRNMTKQHIEVKTSTSTPEQKEKHLSSKRKNFDNALPFMKEKISSSDSRESELSFRSLPQHVATDHGSSYMQEQSTILQSSSSETEQNLPHANLTSEQEKSTTLQSSSTLDHNPPFGGGSITQTKTVTVSSPASMEHCKQKGGLSLEKSLLAQSSSSATDDSTSLKKLSFLKENMVAYQSSSSATEPNLPLNAASSLVETDSMAVHKSSSCMAESSQLTSPPFVQELSTTFQSSSVTDQNPLPGDRSFLQYQSTPLQSSSSLAETTPLQKDASLLHEQSTSFQTPSSLAEEADLSTQTYSYIKGMDLSPQKPPSEVDTVKYMSPENLFISGTPPSTRKKVTLYAYVPSPSPTSAAVRSETSKKGKRKSFSLWKREHAVLPGRILSPDEAKEPTPPRHQILRLLKRGKIRPQHRRTESASLEERKKISRGKTRSKNKSSSYKEGYKQHYFDSDEQDDEFRKSASN